MEIKVSDLLAKLLEAGIPVFGVSSSGRFDFYDDATAEQRALAQTIFDNYDQAAVDAEKEVTPPLPTAQEILAATDLDTLKALLIRLLPLAPS